MLCIFIEISVYYFFCDVFCIAKNFQILFYLKSKNQSCSINQITILNLDSNFSELNLLNPYNFLFLPSLFLLLYNFSCVIILNNSKSKKYGNYYYHSINLHIYHTWYVVNKIMYLDKRNFKKFSQKKQLECSRFS